jgi:hypothetical protein
MIALVADRRNRLRGMLVFCESEAEVMARSSSPLVQLCFGMEGVPAKPVGE